MRKYIGFLFLGIALLALVSCNPFLRDLTYSGSSISIGANANVTGVINISDYGRLDRVKSIKLTGLDHPTANNLEIVLQTPAGTINLIDKEGGTANFVGGSEVYEFVELGDDTGLNQIVSYLDTGYGYEIIPPGIYQANEYFNPGNDEIKGVWTLLIYNTGGSTGSLTSWEVTISVDTAG